MRAVSVLAIVAGALALAGAGGIASADNGGPGTAISYESTYDALIAPETPPAATWNSDPNFDTTGWTIGAPAPFGHGNACEQNGSEQTDFPLGSTIYLRKSFTLPANAFDLHVAGTIDNFADIWVNGAHEGDNPFVGGSCATGTIQVDVPNDALNHGGANLIAVQASDDGSTASFFDMQATYGAIQFGNQPIETQQGMPITDGSGPIQVTIAPPDGGAAIPDGTEVDLTLQTISGDGEISGGTATTVDGVATFPDLQVSAPGEYQLVATSEGATVTSHAFLIANQVTECPANETCTVDGGTSDTQVDVSTSFTTDPKLAVSVIAGGAAIPGDVCGNFTPLGSGSFINILGGVVGGGNITATWTLAKSLVMQAGNPGAAHFNICLGAENLDPNSTLGPWKTKDGSDAVPRTDPNFGITLYWGLLPDCPKHGTSTGPCVLHRNKTGSGQEVVTFWMPYPWDASFHGG